MTPNIVSLECRDIPIEKVVVFNDRAELKRLAKVSLQAGENEVHIKNVSRSFVQDSVRVDGRGDAIIQEVLMQNKHVVAEEIDSPKLAELRAAVKSKQGQVNEIKDQEAILQRRIQVLDKVVGEIGAGVLPKEGGLTVDDALLHNITSVFDFYQTHSTTVRAALREVKIAEAAAEEQLKKLQNELNAAQHHNHRVQSKVCVIVLESKTGGDVELDFVYQVFNCSWKPTYDLRVETTEKPALKITYFAKVKQNTGEDWNETPLVLSTAQPCLGGEIPELGTLEATFWRPPPPQPEMRFLSKARHSGPAQAQGRMAPMAVGAAAEPPAPMIHQEAGEVTERALSTEFMIVRPATIPSSNDDHKVTIGIVDVSPQLVHECVPSKNLSVFLTASAVNSSQLPFLAGEASVYLNNRFVAKTRLKSISPNERFSCSLGVDTSIRVEYKPAKKYHEQTGIINKSSSTVTEQLINLKNTKNQPILLTVKEHIPRSTDEKIKIRVIHPTITPHEETSHSVGDVPETPHEGAKMTAQHNLEWTVKLAGGQIQDLTLKWALDHPKEEKVEFHEKF